MKASSVVLKLLIIILSLFAKAEIWAAYVALKNLYCRVSIQQTLTLFMV